MKLASCIYRVLLIGLLPLIAVVLYVKGQRYDPALIDFKAAVHQASPNPAASLQSAGKSPSPSAAAVSGIAGFRQIGNPHSYTTDTLYEHVDGHAEYFISAGFKGLTVTEYVAAGSKATEAEAQTEVFDMGNGIQAFGVLADESGENAPSISIGTMGFRTSGGVNFIKGRYYVKISALQPKAPVIEFARKFAETLPSTKDSFPAFEKLPNVGKVTNTRFIREGYRGLDFLRNVIEREYSTGDRKITVALITGSEQELRSVMSSFYGYFSKSGIPTEKITRNGTDAYKVLDKYEGTWFLVPDRDAIFGVFGTDDEEILGYFIKGKS